MTATVTTAARRIARGHNQARRSGQLVGGFLLYRRDGTGGEWYSSGSCPPMGPDSIRVTVGWARLTEREAQRLLDGDFA